MNPRIPLPPHLSATPFTFQQGLDAGLGRNRLRSDDLQRPFRGIRTPAVGELALVERAIAYQQKMPQHAHFCGITAAVILGVPLPARQERSLVLHVAVPPPHRAPVGRGIRGHTLGSAPGDVGVWRELRICSPERTWCQLGALLALADLVAAGDYLIHADRNTPAFSSAQRMTDALQRYPGRRGRRRLRAALGLLDAASESPQESRLRVVMLLGGIPGVVANLPITTSGGFRYRADLAFPERKVIVEYQSELHNSPAAFRADMTRVSRLEADGWFVILVNKDDLDNPAELLQRIRQVLATR
ncbi:DUF559 domain-containing protein [Parafrigoribacterium mesophilum]|uniref:endonuclease domain-containing protein n=1 Tax=Parafrigoribacterium mesophilum TaxID=433646 RepID=UPI0031FD5BFE